MGLLLDMLSVHWPEHGGLSARLAAFEGDIGPAGASLPLRVAGGLHALVLQGHAPDLSSVYPPNQVSEDTLRTVMLTALSAHEDFLIKWVESPPQTNEVRRSAAFMAGAAVVRTHFDLPVHLSELGASGGLNLLWDHFSLALPDRNMGCETGVLTLSPDWEGQMPPSALPQVSSRAGVDLNPLDPTKPADLLRLTAYLWPDQPNRIELTRAAAAVTKAPVAKGDAIDWLAQRLDEAPDGHTHIIQHSVAWQYFPQATQHRGRSVIESAGTKATPARPIAWLAMESDGDTKAALGAALTLRLWPGDIRLDLGRADFHGRWIKWKGDH